MNTEKEIKKEDLINQFDLLKKSSDEAYKNQDYNSLAKLTMSMIELYKAIATEHRAANNTFSSWIDASELSNITPTVYSNYVNQGITIG